MSSAPWDPKTETITEYCNRRNREATAALKSAPTFRYEYTPSLSVSYACNGDDCGSDSIILDDDVFVCTTCKTRWHASEAYDGVEGESLEDQGDLSADELAALPIREW